MDLFLYPEPRFFPSAPEHNFAAAKVIDFVDRVAQLPREVTVLQWVNVALLGLAQSTYRVQAHVAIRHGHFHVEICSLPPAEYIWGGPEGLSAQLSRPKACPDDDGTPEWWMRYFEERLHDARREAQKRANKAEGAAREARNRANRFERYVPEKAPHR